jgi:hypothetical protein
MKTFVVVALVIGALPAADGKAVEHRVTLAVAAYSSSEEQVSASSPLAELQVDEAWFSFQNLGFRDAASCDRPATAQVRGPVTVEIVGGRALGMPADVKLGGPYCGVELSARRSRGKTEGVPAGLRGYSILIRARRTDDTRIVIRSKTDRRLWLAAREDGGFSASQDASWFLAVDLARWIGALDLTTADVSHESGRPVIRIDERNNEALLAAFEAALAGGLGLFHDVDGDAVLQASERSGRAWLAAGSD